MNENSPIATDETKLHLAIVGQSYDAQQAARQEAIRRRTERLNEGGRFSRFVKGVWDNVAGDYRQLRDTRTAQREIEASDNIQMFEMSTERAERSRVATLDRFLSQYEEAVHEEAGERRETLSPEDELTQEIKQLIRRNVEGNLSDEALPEERTRIMAAYREAHSTDALGDGKVTIDNLFAIRDAVLGAVEHGESLDRVLENMTVTVGESRSGVRTEAHYNNVDKAIDKLNKTRIGSLVGPEVVATVTTVAATLLRFGSQKVIGAAAMTVAPGVAAGLWAGLRENKRVKDERAQHAREMAMGKEFEESSSRRQEMEKTRYETITAGSLTENLRERFNTTNDDGNHETRLDALDALAATQARIRLSDQQGIDLISFTQGDAENGDIEEQRLALDIALAEAKTIADSWLDPETRRDLGLPRHLDFQALLDQRSDAFMESLTDDISSKDAAFKKLKSRRVAVAAATGIVTGLLIGVGVQEGIAAFDDTRQGLVEQLWNAHNTPFEGQQHQTLLNGIFHGEGGQDIVTHHAADTAYGHYTLGADHGSYDLSADHSLVDNHDGTFNLVDATGHATVEHLPVGADGSLPPESIHTLESHGMNVVNTSHTIDVVTKETHNVSVDQYVAGHQDQVTHVTRDLWYDNDTPSPVFDKNELGLHWGGDTGTSGQGNYAMNVSTMAADGSFSGDQSVNWAEQAQSGNLQLAISASQNTQSEVFMVNIGPDGNVAIPAGSPAAQFFTMDPSGHAVFNGAYAEVVQKAGIDAAGVEHIRPLATFVGHDNVGSIPTVVEVHTPQLLPEYKITTNGYDTSAHFSSFTEMAPVVPVISRRALETVHNREWDRPYGYYNGYQTGELSPEEERIRREETSPRLLRDPNRDLNPREELHWYKELVQKKQGAEYVATIDKLVADSPELSNIQPGLRAIIKVPVNAAGRAESEGIYNILSTYAQQDQESVDKSMVLLHVNWFDDLAQQPDSRAIIDHTRAEIERARGDFPHLKIATIESEWKRSEMQGGVIGHVSRRLNDAAMFAVEHAMEQGSLPDDRDVLLIRNDADAVGVSKNYLKSYVNGAEEHDRTDIFTGTTTFDNTKASKLPGMVYAANFMQSLNLLAAKRDGNVHTAGANFAVRASVLAAVGGVGFDGYNGAGADDVQIGRRIVAARTKKPVYRDGLAGYYQRLRNGYHGRNNTTAANRKIGIRLGGARVDTDSDREEKLYLQGVPMVNTWNHEFGFDKNGYQNRDADLDELRKKFNEDIKGDPGIVIERIRADMEGSINNMGASNSVIDAALAFSFMLPNKQDSTTAYELKKIRTDNPKRPFVYKLKFTTQGEHHLLNHLQRDQRGRPDSYGSRKMRQMYGEAKPSSRRRSTHQSMIRV